MLRTRGHILTNLSFGGNTIFGLLPLCSSGFKKINYIPCRKKNFFRCFVAYIGISETNENKIVV